MKQQYDYSELLTELVRFNTISDNSNLALIDFVETLLVNQQFITKRYYNQTRNKANLIASIGPNSSKGLMFAGHTDVVPVEGQDWEQDPFDLQQKGDRLIGRGTTDMKGFLALICEMAMNLKPEHLVRPIYLVLTYDEEVGCHGAKALSQQLEAIASKVEYALIGEPTNMQLVEAHKGIQLSKTYFKGQAAHSSCPHLGANAILAASHFMQGVIEALPKTQDSAFTPAQTTLNFGTIHGGNAANIIAEHCHLEWEFRPLPNVDTEAFNQSLRQLEKQVEADGQVKIEQTIKALVPGLSKNNNQACLENLKQCLPSSVKVTTAPFVTEAGIFDKAGIPTVVFGPGELEQAHKANESVSIKAMQDYQAFLENLINQYAY